MPDHIDEVPALEQADKFDVIDEVISDQLADQTAFLDSTNEFERAINLRDFERNTRDSLFKRLQATFSPEAHLIKQTRTDRGGLLRKRVDDDLSKKVIIDPERIPDGFAERVTNVTITGDEEAKLAKKAELIPEIKKLFDSAKPFLILVRDPDGKKYQRHIPRVIQLNEPPHLAGKILVFSHATYQEQGYSMSIFDDLFSLTRHYKHVQSGYHGDIGDVGDKKKLKGRPENEQIALLGEWIHDLRQFVADHHAELRDDIAFQRDFKVDLLSMTHDLMDFRNEQKRSAISRVLKSADMQDSKGRHNPSSKIARFTGALHNLKNRALEVVGIENNLFSQENEIRKVLFKCRSAFSRLNKFFAEHPEFAKEISTRDALSRFLNEFEAKAIKKVHLSHADRFNLQPFRAYKDFLLQIIDSLEQVLDLDGDDELDAFDKEQANQSIFRSYLLSKVWEYHVYLEDLVYSLKFADGFDVDSATQKLDKMISTFDADSQHVMPGREVPYFGSLFNAIREKMIQAQGFLKEKSSLSPDEREKLAESIKALEMTDRIKEIDVSFEPVTDIKSTTRRAVKLTGALD